MLPQSRANTVCHSRKWGPHWHMLTVPAVLPGIISVDLTVHLPFPFQDPQLFTGFEVQRNQGKIPASSDFKVFYRSTRSCNEILHFNNLSKEYFVFFVNADRHYGEEFEALLFLKASASSHK